MPVGQKPKVPDAYKPGRQDMQQETAEKFVSGKGHLSFLATVRVVFPAERDPAALERPQPMIGDRDPMGVPCQVMQHVLGTSERALGVDDPVVLEQLAAEAAEVVWLG